MPPNRVDDCTCESLSYGQGATIVEKNFRIAPDCVKFPGSTPHCSGATNTSCLTHFLFSPSPQTVSSTSREMRGATATTIRYVGIGFDWRKRYDVIAFGPLLSTYVSSGEPL